MSNNEHPITPPDELVQQWLCDDNYPCDSHTNSTISIAAGRLRNIATQAARWGADQELEACCEYMHHEDFHGFAQELRAARRPKPPSLAKRALHILGTHGDLSCAEHDTIRRALERLQELEGQGDG